MQAGVDCAIMRMRDLGVRSRPAGLGWPRGVQGQLLFLLGRGGRCTHTSCRRRTSTHSGDAYTSRLTLEELVSVYACAASAPCQLRGCGEPFLRDRSPPANRRSCTIVNGSISRASSSLFASSAAAGSWQELLSEPPAGWVRPLLSFFLSACPIRHSVSFPQHASSQHCCAGLGYHIGSHGAGSTFQHRGRCASRRPSRRRNQSFARQVCPREATRSSLVPAYYDHDACTHDHDAGANDDHYGGADHDHFGGAGSVGHRRRCARHCSAQRAQSFPRPARGTGDDLERLVGERRGDVGVKVCLPALPGSGRVRHSFHLASARSDLTCWWCRRSQVLRREPCRVRWRSRRHLGRASRHFRLGGGSAAIRPCEPELQPLYPDGLEGFDSARMRAAGLPGRNHFRREVWPSVLPRLRVQPAWQRLPCLEL